jgi:hypothetical protein
MKNQIVLDFKLLVLRSEHTICNTLVHIFCCNFRSMLFSITVKKCTKYIILYVRYVDVLISNPTRLDFSFYDFSVIYYDFSKLL